VPRQKAGIAPVELLEVSGERDMHAGFLARFRCNYTHESTRMANRRNATKSGADTVRPSIELATGESTMGGRR